MCIIIEFYLGIIVTVIKTVVIAIFNYSNKIKLFWYGFTIVILDLMISPRIIKGNSSKTSISY